MREELARLADALAEARSTGHALDGQAAAWLGLSEAEAMAIGESFRASFGADRSPFWKLGAIDDATQSRLGVSGPVLAPLAPPSVSTEVTSAVIDRSTLIAPRFEPEIGIALRDGEALLCICVEIADSRFAGWALPRWGVHADATLQGQMVFGPAQPPRQNVMVVVRHEGRELAVGSGTWSDAVQRLELLPAGETLQYIATGSLTPLFDCEPGDWEFDFGELGALAIRVV